MRLVPPKWMAFFANCRTANGGVNCITANCGHALFRAICLTLIAVRLISSRLFALIHGGDLCPVYVVFVDLVTQASSQAGEHGGQAGEHGGSAEVDK